MSKIAVSDSPQFILTNAELAEAITLAHERASCGPVGACHLKHLESLLAEQLARARGERA